MLRRHERNERRLERIIKQSDKQQMDLLKLNKELDAYKDRLEAIHRYDVQQQKIARGKVEANIVVDANTGGLAVDALFLPSDILSGDFYSVYRKEDGSLLFFILDGQGHGISPSLTVFGAASVLNRYARQKSASLQDLLDRMLPYLREFLADEEQLSFTIMEIDPSCSSLQYAIGGMYPVLLKMAGAFHEIRSNNLPILDFSPAIRADTLPLSGFESLLLYTDGLVEGEGEWVERYAPEKLLREEGLLERARTELPRCEREDDITILTVTRNLPGSGGSGPL